MKNVSISQKCIGALSLVMLTASVLIGCSSSGSSSTPASEGASVGSDDQSVAASSMTEAMQDEASSDMLGDITTTTEMTPTAKLRIGSLKGPTTIGLVNLMADVEEGRLEAPYSFIMETDPSVLAAKVVSGEVDVALVPANLASVLYNKTKGGVVAININTLGVLDCVTNDETISHVSDLTGKMVLMTGQGATPEYALHYLLTQNNVTDCTITFAAEATEVAARLQEEPGLIAVLPQPFATSAMMQNESLKRAFSLTDEWQAVTQESTLVTGVTIIRKDVLNTIGTDEVSLLNQLQSASVAQAYANPDLTATRIVQQEIIAKEQIAKAALPFCGLPTDKEGQGMVITADTMEQYLSGYLQTLYDADPAAVGGSVPDEGFYLN